jgi:phage/plasmid-like protein (TIGR03299 family)
MSHELTVREDGTAEMFAAGNQPVWHRLGQRTESAVTSEAAIRMAALDWLVVERPIMVLDPDGEMSRVSSHKAIVRKDTNSTLGVVGRRYTPIQNHEAFAWLDAVVGERLAMYETAGSLHGGKVIWMLIRLPHELRVRNTDDVSRPYVLVCNAHDGSQALRVLTCSIRVICNNTLTMALREGREASSLAIRHTESIHERVEDARKTIGIAAKRFEHLQHQMNRLSERPIKKDELERYFKVIWPDPPEAEDTSRAEAVREQLMENFHLESQRLPGSSGSRIAGTAWAAFNAVTMFTDHQRPTRGRTDYQRENNRLASIWLGDSAALKRRAWDEAMQLVVN